MTTLRTAATHVIFVGKYESISGLFTIVTYKNTNGTKLGTTPGQSANYFIPVYFVCVQPVPLVT